MEKLWAPWRSTYLAAKKQKGCIFCLKKKHRKNDYIIFETTHTRAMLNLYPYNNGHLMIAPRRHVKDFKQLKDVEVLDFFRALVRAQELLTKVLKPHGFNVGFNISRVAGAGIASHMHLHVVPRWNGDTNFMPLLSNTKVISQSLDELYTKLKDAESE